jgi:hypothetical protein
MLPEAEHQPASFLQCTIIALVALDVTLQLGSPIAPLVMGDVSVQWAAMPKTSIDENGDFLAREHYVRAASQTY